MTWKLYALTSSGALAVTYLLSAPDVARDVDTRPALPRAISASGTVVDLGAEADRLRTRLSHTTAYQEPVRDAFRFGGVRPRVAESAPGPSEDFPPVVTVPVRPPFGLAGVASSTVDGVQERTAILSSLGGVVLAKEGDVIDGGFHVVAVADDAVTVESTADGTTTVLRFADAAVR